MLQQLDMEDIYSMNGAIFILVGNQYCAILFKHIIYIFI